MPKKAYSLQEIEKALGVFKRNRTKSTASDFIILHPKVYAKVKRMGKLRALAARLRGEDA